MLWQGQIFTSAKEVMWYPTFIQFICWFVSRLHKKLQVDLVGVFREGNTRPNLSVVRFWWWSGSASESRIDWRILYQTSAEHGAAAWWTQWKNDLALAEVCALRVPF